MRRFNIQIDISDMDKYCSNLKILPIYFIDNKTNQENRMELREVIPLWLISKIENYDLQKYYHNNIVCIGIVIRYINRWFNRSNIKICYLNYGYKIDAYTYNDINSLNYFIKYQRQLFYPNLAIENFDLKNRLQIAYDLM